MFYSIYGHWNEVKMLLVILKIIAILKTSSFTMIHAIHVKFYHVIHVQYVRMYLNIYLVWSFRRWTQQIQPTP